MLSEQKMAYKIVPNHEIYKKYHAVNLTNIRPAGSEKESFCLTENTT